MALREKVAFLRRPDSYPDGVGDVEAIETHMAWVFLAGDRAYKLKKPVRTDFLDFSTLEARRLDSEAEVRLNRRLAPHVYLGTVPLTHGDGERLHLGGRGPPVEWLVEMRRLPRERMLDRAAASGPPAQAELRPAADLLARFHAAAAPAPVDPCDYLRRLHVGVAGNRGALLAHAPDVPVVQIRRVGEALFSFLERREGLFVARVRQGRVVEGHGDLRPEHIYLGSPPAVIDCLEFNRAFRTLDAADDLAFLALECERLGVPGVGEVFLDAYRQRSGDTPPRVLMEFHMAQRAFLRAKIAIWHLKDGEAAEPADRWTKLARTYLGLAEVHVARAGNDGGAD